MYKEGRKQMKGKENEKGITGIDLTIAVILIMMLLSVILALFYNNYLNSQATKRNAEANTFVTNLFTYAETLDYAEVTETTLRTYINSEFGKYNVVAQENEGDTENNLNNHSYSMYVTVTNYKDMPENQGKDLQDYIKLIQVKVSYNVGNKIDSEEFSTLKVIERE